MVFLVYIIKLFITFWSISSDNVFRKQVPKNKCNHLISYLTQEKFWRGFLPRKSRYRLLTRHHSRFFDCLAHQNLSATSYLLPKFCRVPLTIALIPLISTVVNGTLLNFDKRYEDNLRVIFDQWPKLHLGLDASSNQWILNGI